MSKKIKNIDVNKNPDGEQGEEEDEEGKLKPPSNLAIGASQED